MNKIRMSCFCGAAQPTREALSLHLMKAHKRTAAEASQESRDRTEFLAEHPSEEGNGVVIKTPGGPATVTKVARACSKCRKPGHRADRCPAGPGGTATAPHQPVRKREALAVVAERSPDGVLSIADKLAEAIRFLSNFTPAERKKLWKAAEILL